MKVKPNNNEENSWWKWLWRYSWWSQTSWVFYKLLIHWDLLKLYFNFLRFTEKGQKRKYHIGARTSGKNILWMPKVWKERAEFGEQNMKSWSHPALHQWTLAAARTVTVWAIASGTFRWALFKHRSLPVCTLLTMSVVLWPRRAIFWWTTHQVSKLKLCKRNNYVSWRKMYAKSTDCMASALIWRSMCLEYF